MKKKYQLKIKNKWEKVNIKISKQLRDIIHGYIMSDGYVSLGGSLQIDQSEKQEKFVKWLYTQLEPLRTKTPICKKIRFDLRTNTKTYSNSFNTRSLLKGFRHMWYKPYIDQTGQLKYLKTLPKSINCFFNSVFITLWFAGDGTKMINQRGAKLEVTAFSPEERKKLQFLFKQKFNLLAQINRAGKTKNGTEQWTLSINADQYDKFRDIITKIDLIPTLFPYKLHSVR
jgi:hypothetical protein